MLWPQGVLGHPAGYTIQSGGCRVFWTLWENSAHEGPNPVSGLPLYWHTLLKSVTGPGEVQKDQQRQDDPEGPIQDDGQGGYAVACCIDGNPPNPRILEALAPKYVLTSAKDWAGLANSDLTDSERKSAEPP